MPQIQKLHVLTGTLNKQIKHVVSGYYENITKADNEILQLIFYARKHFASIIFYIIKNNNITIVDNDMNLN